ncbi:MAG: DUF6057 family protein [Bacteroidales bacterium]|nr:DUF6057 family protein [Bacteroidales bacterium]MDD4822287.1 DUF6057 family protein [Bacteroidales bacterium]
MKKPIINDTRRNKKKPFSYVTKSDFLYFNLICAFLFVFVAYYLTGIHNVNYLIKIEELSLFLPTNLYLSDCMKSAGGLLVYCGTFLTQFFYHPWQGSTIFVTLLLLLSYLAVKAFRIPGKYSALALIPSAMLLLSLTEVGYLIYILKSPGYFYSNLLGVIVTLCSFWGYRIIHSWKCRTLFIALFIFATYLLFGFYTLFATLLCVVYEITSYFSDKNSRHFYPLMTAILFAIFIPYFYYVFLSTRMLFTYIYIAGLPKFYFNDSELTLWIPFVLLFLCIILFTFFLFKRPKTNKADLSFVSVSFLYLLSLAGTYYYSFEDENFRASLDMDLAIFRNDWNRVLEDSKGLKGEPTRLIVMNTNLALHKSGIAADKMFSFKNASVPYDIPRLAQVLRNAGAKALYFQYGKINYCYRWCMEDKVEYGLKVEYLKYMVKCALMNREFPLAQKYNSTLMKTLFHKKWALKYQKYIDNPSLIEKDPEFKAIIPLMAYDDILDGDAGLIEVYLVNNFAYMQGGPPELVDLSIQNNLILKDINRFWPRFFLYARTHDHIPVHYQEAAVLYSYLEKKVDINNVKIDPQIYTRFSELLKMSETYAGKSNEFTSTALKNNYGDTFWYYYFFIKDLKTN